MKKRLYSFSAIFLFLLCLLSCKNGKTGKPLEHEDEKRQIFFGNAIYHWKNTFDPTDEELKFLMEHDVKRIYVRLFDVVDTRSGKYCAEPSATVKFLGKIPNGVEIVPTVFITNEAMGNIGAAADIYANLIYKRVKAMTKANVLGTIREVQLDCDWSEKTQNIYFSLCESLRSLLKPDSAILSSTIRLHQLKNQAPPVDCGVLMLYNTANVKDILTKNSILSYEDVKPYLKKKVDYALPLSFSYPAFGWDVLFKYDEFQHLCNIPDSILRDTTCFKFQRDSKNRYEAIKDIPQLQIKLYNEVRHERALFDDLLQVKALVEKRIHQKQYPSILYHLDGEQLSHLSNSQIDRIYE